MEPQIKIAFQDPDSGLFEINKPGSKEPPALSEEQFRKLRSLMNDTKWIIVNGLNIPTGTQSILPTENKTKLN